MGFLCVKEKEGDVGVRVKLTLTNFNETLESHSVRVLNFKFIKICRRGLAHILLLLCYYQFGELHDNYCYFYHRIGRLCPEQNKGTLKVELFEQFRGSVLNPF